MEIVKLRFSIYVQVYATWFDYLTMTANETDYDRFYFNGSSWTGIWTSSPISSKLVRMQGGKGSVNEFGGNWGSHQKYNARQLCFE